MMRRTIAFPGIALGFAALVVAGPALAEEYTIDPDHTQANFRVTHSGFSDIWGRFNEESGVIVFDPDNIEASSVEIVILTASVDTNHLARDEDLRSPNFFSSAEFPEMTFKSTSVEMIGENTGVITGDLTLLGVTKPVTMDVVFNKVGTLPWDESTEIIGFSASTVIDRAEFGMNYGMDGDGEDVQINLEVEGNRPL